MDLIKQFRILQHIKNDDKQQLRNKTMSKESEQLGKDMNHVGSVISEYGFNYTFLDHSGFADIENKEFHELQDAYVAARRNLENFIDDNYSTEGRED